MKYLYLITMLILIVNSKIIDQNKQETIKVQTYNLIDIEVYPLNINSSILPGSEPCNKYSANATLRGCTAVPGSSAFAYPFDNNPVALDMETQYLPNVLPREMFPPEFHQNAMNAQAIAARTYAYYHIEHQGEGSLDNSTNYQVYMPYSFLVAGVIPGNDNQNLYPAANTAFEKVDKKKPCATPRNLLTTSQYKVCTALKDKKYMTDSSGDIVHAEFFADKINGAAVAGQNYIYYDPISDQNPPCSASNNGHGRGMSQKGASRWSYGNQCSTNNPYDPWPVRYTHPQQVLTHYYAGIAIRNVSNDAVVSANLRWNMIAFDWLNTDKNNLQPGHSYPVELTLRNTSTYDWTCTTSISYRLVYRWIDPYTSIPGSNTLDLCNSSIPISYTSASARTFSLNLNTPVVCTGNYTLLFDLQVGVTVNGQTGYSNFSSSGKTWPFSFGTKINGQSCTSHPVVAEGQLDLVFVVDTTGSTGPVLDQIKASMSRILDTLDESRLDYRIGIVDFQDFPQDTGIPTDHASNIRLSFTSNRQSILTSINNLSVVTYSGGDAAESVYSGLMAAITGTDNDGVSGDPGLTWRPEVERSIILITDAQPHDPENYTGYTLQSVLDAATGTPTQLNSLNDSPISISALINDLPAAEGSPYQRLTRETHGSAVFVSTAPDPQGTAPTLTEWTEALLDLGQRETTQFLQAHLPATSSAGVGQAITFDARESRSAFGPVQYYEWDWTDDGIPDQITAEPTTTYTYTTPYHGAARVTVYDEQGHSSSAITRVGVPSILPPRIYLPLYIYSDEMAP